MNEKDKVALEEMMGYFLAVVVIVIFVAWLVLACVAPFALLKLCGLILLA